MDLFKFYDDAFMEATVLNGGGQYINGALSKVWTERYASPGEFQISAKLSSGLKDFLPEGTLIGNVESYEVMVVENVEVNEKLDEDPDVTISGRSLPALLEHRIVGTNLARASSTVGDYKLFSQASSGMATLLVNDHIGSGTYVNDNLSNIVCTSTAPALTATDTLTIPRNNVLQELMGLLAIDDLGIRTVRRNNFGLSGSSTQTTLVVWRGADKSDSVIYSWRSGLLQSADYLFSRKKRKNSALVVGRYIWTVVDTGPTKYDRHMMVVDASDIDGAQTAVPTGPALTLILAAMEARGKQVLKSQTNIAITRADVSESNPYRYRHDYNIGDLVTVDGNYGQMAKVRVVEYSEIEDENGETGHPTFSLPTSV